MFRPITNSMEERLELIKNSMSKEIASKELQKCESLEDFYHYARQVKNGVIAQMQIFVLENYEKLPLEVWNKDNFKITPHTGKDVIYFGKKDTYTKKWNIKSLEEHAKKRWEKSIKIEKISFTLDEHDGDFSVKFNDSVWTFLWEDEIVEYYYTVKRFLENAGTDK